MHLRESVVIALRSMRAARLRTALTALGIVVGVAVVLVLVGLSNGVQDGFSRQFGDFNRKILVSKATVSMPGGNAARALTESDLHALVDAQDRGHYSTVTAQRNGSGLVRYAGKTFSAVVAGADEGFLQIRNRTIVAGRMYDQQDNADRNRVVVIGPKVVNYLFDGDSQGAVGQQVFVGRLGMKVIGVLSSAGDDQDHFVMMPLDTGRLVLGGAANLNGLSVMADSLDQVPHAVSVIQQVLDKRHDIKDAGFRDYVTAPLLTEISRVDKYLTLLTWLTLLIGGLSLLVGTLGVANVMMVTVTNRTAEIGIRKAIGARRSAILKQFLAESVVLAGLGGVVGVGLGVGLIWLAGRLVPRWIPQVGVPNVSVATVLAVFGLSLLIGLVAGTHPAVRAARLHPIDALRA
ncbi:MAG TPA: ABC transporter permease [Pseudonocardia sp.]|jgi:putative ABC transport system permease protein